nr:hypothetical protein [Tanacetum cinerariifolium]
DDLGVSRRPYHRNCNCPLHKMCEHSSGTSTISNVSYPVKRIGSQGSIAMMVSRNDSSSSNYSAMATRPINKFTLLKRKKVVKKWELDPKGMWGEERDCGKSWKVRNGCQQNHHLCWLLEVCKNKQTAGTFKTIALNDRLDHPTDIGNNNHRKQYAKKLEINMLHSYCTVSIS